MHPRRDAMLGTKPRVRDRYEPVAVHLGHRADESAPATDIDRAVARRGGRPPRPGGRPPWGPRTAQEPREHPPPERAGWKPAAPPLALLPPRRIEPRQQVGQHPV